MAQSGPMLGGFILSADRLASLNACFWQLAFKASGHSAAGKLLSYSPALIAGRTDRRRRPLQARHRGASQA